MDCFGTYFTHVQTCDNVRVQSATQWTVSVHILHMSKLVITFMFKVLHNGLLRYIPYTCQTCDKARVQSATQWIMLPPALAPVARPRPTRFHHVRCPGARAPANTLPSSSCHPACPLNPVPKPHTSLEPHLRTYSPGGFHLSYIGLKSSIILTMLS